MTKPVLIYLALLCLGLVVACKRKQVEVKPNGTVVKTASYCYDGKRNGDELATDCGGSCLPCVEAEPTCQPDANTLTFEEIEYAVTAISCKTNSSNNYEISCMAMNSNVKVKIQGVLPDVTKIYNCNDVAEPGSDEASIEINSPTLGTMKAIEGKVTASYKNGKYLVTVCDAKFYSFVTGNSYNANSLGITCN